MQSLWGEKFACFVHTVMSHFKKHMMIYIVVVCSLLNIRKFNRRILSKPSYCDYWFIVRVCIYYLILIFTSFPGVLFCCCYFHLFSFFSLDCMIFSHFSSILVSTPTILHNNLCSLPLRYFHSQIIIFSCLHYVWTYLVLSIFHILFECYCFILLRI